MADELSRSDLLLRLGIPRDAQGPILAAHDQIKAAQKDGAGQDEIDRLYIRLWSLAQEFLLDDRGLGFA